MVLPSEVSSNETKEGKIKSSVSKSDLVIPYKLKHVIAFQTWPRYGLNPSFNFNQRGNCRGLTSKPGEYCWSISSFDSMFWVPQATGSHPIPFRTRKLSPPALMVLLLGESRPVPSTLNRRGLLISADGTPFGGE